MIIKLFLILTLGFPTLIFAEKKVKLLYFMAPMDAPKNVVALYKKGKYLDINLPRTRFSETYSVPSETEKIYFLPERMDTEEELNEKAPSVTIPKDWEKILLLSFPDPDNPVLPVKFAAINAGDKRFTPGTIMFVNHTDKFISGTVGAKNLLLKPNDITYLSNPADSIENYRTKLFFYSENKNKKSPFISRIWRHSTTYRKVFFIYPSKRPDRLKYHTATVYDL